MRFVRLAIGAVCARTVFASSWPYTRTLKDGTTPADENNDKIPDLFVEWLRGAIANDGGEVTKSFQHGHVPKSITSLQELEKHGLEYAVNRTDLPPTPWDNIPAPENLSAAQEANILFRHLNIQLDPECISKKEKYWYRTADGSCNWLKRGQNMLGATGQPRSRDFKQTTYADGISTPREGPNAREVSNAFFQRKERLHYEHTPLMLGLVEFLMHDVTYSEDSDTEMIEVPIPPNDPAYKHRANETFKIWRSKPVPGTGTDRKNPRQHVNGATAWLDCSALYGSTQEVMDALRSHKDGKLKSQRGKDGFDYLPFNVDNLPVRTRPGVDSTKLFLGGDVRTNEDYILLSVHTLLLREHNRMCDILVAQHPDWDDERIFQTIRLAMGAKVALIGNAYQMAYWTDHMPWPRDDGFPLFRAIYGSSALTINPIHAYPWPLVTRDDRPMVTSAEMAIVYRFHEFIINNFPLKDARNVTISNETLFNTAFNATGFMEIGADSVLRGMLAKDIPNFKSGVDETFRSAGQYRGHMFDIVTWSIVHEREQGLPTFNQYFHGYNTMTPEPELKVKIRKKFEDFTTDPHYLAELKRLYKHPDDVDLVVGVQLEEELFPGTTMPISALIPSLFSLFGVGNSDRFSPGFAVTRCLFVDKPWDCHPSNALEDLLWEPRPTEDFPYKRWFSDFWMKELDLQTHGMNLLWRIITENSGAKCIQKNPLFPFDPETNPILCELEEESDNFFYFSLGSAVLAILGSGGYFWRTNRSMYALQSLPRGVDAPSINWGKPVLGVSALLQRDTKDFLLRQFRTYRDRTFGLRLVGSIVYFIAGTERDVEIMTNDYNRASLVELTKDHRLGKMVGQHNFKDQLQATVIRRCLETESAQHLPHLASVVQKTVHEWLEERELHVDGGKIADFRPLAAELTARVMIRICIGSYDNVYKESELIQAFIALNKGSSNIFSIATLLPRWISGPLAKLKVRHQHKTIQKFVLPVVRQRRTAYDQAHPATSSLLDEFLNAEERNSNVAQLVSGIVIGSLTNMTDTLTNALYWVAEADGSSQRTLRTRESVSNITPLQENTPDPWKPLRSVTLETLRMAGGAIGPVRKIVAKGFRLGSNPTLQLPRGSALAASPLLMHFDEKNYDKPNDFIADRFVTRDAPLGTHKFLTFGLPSHTCPGRFFAIETVSIALNAIISRYEIQPLAQPTGERHQYSLGGTVTPRKPMPVKLRPRA